MGNDVGGHDLWSDLSFGDLEEWVGSTYLSRGRDYQKKKRVLLLACSPEGELSAQVAGSGLYATTVERDDAGNLSSVCSCPLGGDCKHAVAVVLEYLERVKGGKEVPSELPALPGKQPAALPVESSDEDEVTTTREVPGKPPKASGRARKTKKVSVEEYLHGLTAAELVALILELASTSEDINRLLKSRAELADGDFGAIVHGLRKELARVSSEPSWRNSWTGEGHTPDYSLVTKYLKNLLAAGQADLVLQLGLEVIAAGTEQVETADDEGDTEAAVSEALSPVWEALSQSSLSAAERILWLYDRYLEEEYDLCDGAEDEADIWEVGAEVWNQVADALLARLETKEMHVRREDYGTHYRRDRVGHWAICALQGAGREGEAVELALREARITQSYERAVNLLIEVGRLEEARALALEGIKQTQAKLPGIASQLRTRLRELAGKEENHALETAFLAEEFFLRPSLEGYRSLRQATQQVGLWDAVREQTLSALQTGSSPLRGEAWPLPDTSTPPEPERPGAQSLQSHLLTEIALDEGDHVEALKWYHKASADRFGWGGIGLAEQVAREVAGTHPDESIGIWRKLAEQCIGRGNRSGYEESLRHLRPLRRLLIQSERQDEWEAYLAALCEEHRRKRALLETLDALQDGPILGG
jgi:uncharacterized Zn finger protein